MGPRNSRKKKRIPVTQNSIVSRQNQNTENVTKTIEKKTTRKKKHALFIRRFHTLNKQIEQLKEDTKISDGERKLQIDLLEKEKEEMGGIQAYQQASLRGEQRHSAFNSAKWVIEVLLKHQLKPEPGSKLKLLDVGALSVNYAKQKQWIDAIPIDLNPQNNFIQKQNFLDMGDNAVHFKNRPFDVIVLSLVLNFDGNASSRGKMLKNVTEILSPNGHVVIVLPLPCIENSRYCDDEKFLNLCTLLDFHILQKHFSKKLAFYFFQFKPKDSNGCEHLEFPKKLLHSGNKRNNFHIVLKPNDADEYIY